MAQFKLDLLTSRYDQQLIFLRTNITSYQQAQHHCEKLTVINSSVNGNLQYDTIYNVKYRYKVKKGLKTINKFVTLPTVHKLNDSLELELEHNIDETVIPNQILFIEYDIKSNYNYSYNEKFAIHANAQKDLSFDMDSKILYNDVLMENPFISALHIGTQLLLTDKYNQQHIMTIKDIKFKISNANIVYSYSCEDSFHYQLVHQQTSYNIINDPTTIDFIGAKTLDFGAGKIHDECFMAYQYIPFKNILYQDLNDIIQEYKYIASPSDKTTLSNVQSIIKPAYIDSYFDQTVSFSSSNNNPLATLIALGQELDCQVNIYEYIHNDGRGEHYFGFEPIKKNNPTGLKYSPVTDIQNFNLEYQGDNLATILNVTSRTTDDKLITMIPETPSVFLSYFLSDEWLNSIYKDGMYYDFIDGDTFTLLNRTSQLYTVTGIDNELINILGLKFSTVNKIGKTRYPLIRFDHNNNYSTINYVKSNEAKFVLLVPQENPDLTIVVYENIPQELDTTANYIKVKGKNGFQYYKGTQGHYQLITADELIQIIHYVIVPDRGEIPFNIVAEDQDCYIGSLSNTTESSALTNLYIKNYRYSTDNERLFARIADKCPGLENRLINLDYLVNHQIMSDYARKNLMNILTNKIRIINGKLLSYTATYFTAVHKQTRTIANMTQAIDHLNAIVHADIIAPYTKDAAVLTYDTFDKAYNELYSINSSNHQTALFNYDQLLDDYLNKDFNAEQRFLKAIKEFQDFFNDTNQGTLGSNKIATTTLSIQNTTEGVNNKKIVYSFDSGSDIISIYTKQKDSKTQKESGIMNPAISTGKHFITDIYQVDKNNNYILLKLPEENTGITYYVPNRIKNTIIPYSSNYQYNSKQEYFLLASDYQSIINTTLPKDRQTIEDDKIYIRLTYAEVCQAILYGSPDKYYNRITDYYIPFNWIRYKWNSQKKDTRAFRGIEYKVLNFDVTKKNLKEDKAYAGATYINNLDLDSIYYYGPVLKQSNNEVGLYNKYNFERFNEYNYNQEEWNKRVKEHPEFTNGTNPQEYNTFQIMPFVHHMPTAAINALFEFDLDRYLELTTRQKESFPYYTGCKATQLLVGARNIDGSGQQRSYYEQLNYQTQLEEKILWIQHGTTAYTFEPINFTQENSGIRFKHKLLNDPPAYNEIGDNTNALFALNANAAQDSAIYTNIGLQQDEGKKLPSENWIEGWKRNRFYFNYYGLIAATYSLNNEDVSDSIDLQASALIVNNKYNLDYKLGVHNPGFYSILQDTAILNKNDQYYCLVLGYSNEDEKDGKGTFFADNHGPAFNKGDNLDANKPLRFNAVQYSSILQNAFNPLDLSTISDKEGKNNLLEITKVGQVVKNNNDPILTSHSIVQDQRIIFKKYINSTLGYVYFLILRYEPYERAVISNEKTTVHTNGDDYKLSYQNANISNVYDCRTDVHIDLLQHIPSNNTLYIRQLEDDNFIETQDFTDITKPYYYKDVDQQYHLTYTYAQLQSYINYDNQHPTEAATRIPLYCRLNDTYTNTDLIHHNLDKQQVFYVPIYKQIIERDNNAVVTYNQSVFLGTQVLSYDNDQDLYTITTDKGDQITVKKVINSFMTIPQMTNGSFGYKYHNKIEGSSIFTQCMMIETQLTSAGERALIASKNCRFFLPDSGLPKENESDNNFFKDIIKVIDENHVQLSSLYLPKVIVYTHLDSNHQISNLLPKYRFHYHRIGNAQEPSQDNKNDKKNQDDKTEGTALNQTPLKDNLSLLEGLCNDLKIKITQISVMAESAETSYYVADYGGTLGGQLITKLQNKSTAYERFSGGYSIAFQLIDQYYTKTDLLIEYQALLKEKQDIGTNLYQQYPNVLIEKEYANEHALTSEELFQSAQLYFKDYFNPEERYTLSLIDVQTLQGYHGQALQIGDAIQLETDDGYHNQDDLYHSLNKFLFITDISYDLRKDDSMSVTVNTIKYQEKLLQQLVSLIR